MTSRSAATARLRPSLAFTSEITSESALHASLVAGDTTPMPDNGWSSNREGQYRGSRSRRAGGYPSLHRSSSVREAGQDATMIARRFRCSVDDYKQNRSMSLKLVRL